MGRVSRLSFNTPPPNFHFWNTVCSHGWCILAPFSVDEDEQKLNGVLELPGHRLARVSLNRPNKRGKLVARLKSSAKLDSKALAEARRQIATILRLDEDLSSFYHTTAE